MRNSHNASKHIFLFILDAVRKDHLSLYGYKRKTTPNIDRLAKQATVYNWAFSPAPYTLASVPSILTGKYPVELSNIFTGFEFTERDFENFGKLKKLGYKTAMFTANIVTSHYQTNLYKFFDYFWDNLSQKELNREDMLYEKAEVVLEAVKEFIKKNKEDKLFVVIHLMEAHGPYVPEVESKFKGDELYKKDKRKITRVVNDSFTGVSYELLKKEKVSPKYQLLDLVEGPNGEIEDFNRNVADYIAKYDMGIYLLDKNVGEFIEFLKKEGLFDPSEIIITSDHGELLGEENIFFSHGIMCHPALISVPLIIKEPYQKKKKVVDHNFSLVSIIDAIKGKYKKQEEVFAFHPQSLAVVKEDSFIMFHNGNFSHNGDLKTSIFATASFSLEQIFENFIDFELDGKVMSFRKNYSNLTFSRKDKVELESVLSTYLKFIKYNFITLKEKIEDRINHLNNQLIKKLQENENLQKQLTQTLKLIEENQRLLDQINQTKDNIKNLETILNKIKSAKFFKLWQGYCKIMKVLRLKRKD